MEKIHIYLDPLEGFLIYIQQTSQGNDARPLSLAPRPSQPWDSVHPPQSPDRTPKNWHFQRKKITNTNFANCGHVDAQIYPDDWNYSWVDGVKHPPRNGDWAECYKYKCAVEGRCCCQLRSTSMCLLECVFNAFSMCTWTYETVKFKLFLRSICTHRALQYPFTSPSTLNICLKIFLIPYIDLYNI